MACALSFWDMLSREVVTLGWRASMHGRVAHWRMALLDYCLLIGRFASISPLIEAPCLDLPWLESTRYVSLIRRSAMAVISRGTRIVYAVF
jgi:hypothetical protein